MHGARLTKVTVPSLNGLLQYEDRCGLDPNFFQTTKKDHYGCPATKPSSFEYDPIVVHFRSLGLSWNKKANLSN